VRGTRGFETPADTGPLSVVSGYGQPTRGHTPETLPDMSLPSERIVWRSKVRGGVLVELPEMDRRFAEAIARDVAVGLRGRGTCKVTLDGLLFASFGLTEAESRDSRVVEEYASHLIDHLGLDRDALVFAVIDTVEVDPDIARRADRAIARLGLRAVEPPTSAD
jgi:hypothetical protein